MPAGSQRAGRPGVTGLVDIGEGRSSPELVAALGLGDRPGPGEKVSAAEKQLKEVKAVLIQLQDIFSEDADGSAAT